MARRDATIFQVLRREHRQILELFEKLGKEDDPTARRRLLPLLREELLAHAQAEFATFYEVFRMHEQTQDQVLECEQEHQTLDRLLGDLGDGVLDVAEPAWRARLELLRENVEAHMREEERQIFGPAQELISGQQAEYLAARFLEARKEGSG